MDNEILLRNELTGVVVELPSELDNARPIVEVGNWSVEIAGQTGGFGVKNEVHVSSKMGTLNLGISAAPLGNC
jgi:hypothetical protein